MKSLRKLLKGIISDYVVIAVIMAFVLLVLIFSGDSSGTEAFVLRLFGCAVLVAVLLTVGGIYLAVVCYRYGQARNELCAIPGFSKERFEREALRSPQFVRLIAASDAICYTGAGHIACVIPMTDIIWVYQPDGTNVLNIYTRDREIHKVNVHIKGKGAAENAKKGIRYLMRLIARKNKNVLIGYNPSYEELYKHDFVKLAGMASGREIIDSGRLEQEYIENDYYHRDFQ